MTYRKLTASIAAAALLCTLAGPAQALSRDTGVGLEIAAQGNVALQTIRAELKAALLAAVKPVLPAPPAAATTKVAAGGALPTAATARCAE